MDNLFSNVLDDLNITYVGQKNGTFVLRKDLVLEEKPLKIKSFTQPSTVLVRSNDNSAPENKSDDKLVYLPSDGFMGTDTFAYTVNNLRGAIDTATVTTEVEDSPTSSCSCGMPGCNCNLGQNLSDPLGSTVFINLNNINPQITQSSIQPINDSLRVDENEGAGFYEQGNLLSNDTGTNLRVTKVNGETIGDGKWVRLDPGAIYVNQDGRFDFTTDGNFDYLASGQSQSFAINYTVEGDEGTSIAQLNVTVDGLGRGSINANNDTLRVDENEGAGFYEQGNLLSNDTGTNLRVTTVNGETIGDGRWVQLDRGTIYVNQDGRFDFSANDEFSYLQSFQGESLSINYTVEGSEGTDTAQLNVTVDGLDGAIKDSGKVVRFVYFIEQGQSYDQRDFDAIKNSAFDLQEYWYEQFGATFNLTDQVVDVIYGDQIADWYVDTPDGIHGDNSRWYRLGNIKNEVYGKLGVSDSDPNVRVINFPEATYDGRVGVKFGGGWMDGDDLSALGGRGRSYPYPDGNEANALAHVAHEFGHIYGLAHPEVRGDSVMSLGFYKSYVPVGMPDFLRENVDLALSLPQNEGWFDAVPGDRVLV